MRSFEEMETLWSSAAPLPRERGVVQHLVVRLGGGQHDEPERLEMSPQLGVFGDRWSTQGGHPAAQVTLMMKRVAELCGAGSAEFPLHLPGDNLLVDLDLAEEHVPVGTRLRAGSALLEVTDKPHLGCAKFRARLGDEALRWVNHPEHRGRRLRGVNTRVLEAGVVVRGDAILVVKSPT